MSPEGGRFVIDISVWGLDMDLGLRVVYSRTSNRTTTDRGDCFVLRDVPSLRHRRADVVLRHGDTKQVGDYKAEEQGDYVSVYAVTVVWSPKIDRHPLPDVQQVLRRTPAVVAEERTVQSTQSNNGPLLDNWPARHDGKQIWREPG